MRVLICDRIGAIVVARHALNQRSKGSGHTVMKTCDQAARLKRGRRHTAAAWADHPGAFSLLIGQKSSSSGKGPQSLSKFRELRRSDRFSRTRLSSVLFGVLECVLNIRAMLLYLLG